MFSIVITEQFYNFDAANQAAVKTLCIFFEI